jgi:integrase
MDRTLEKTSTPGVYKRGGRYVVIYRDPHGRQRKRAARTLAEAREVKATLTADVARGEYRAASRETFADYAARWVATYAGRTSRGLLDETREDYRKRLEADALPFFGRMRLTAIEPQHVRDFIRAVSARGVKPNTVRLALAPVRALFATAVEDGILRANPAAGVRIIAARETFDVDGEAEEDVKALAPAELEAVLEEIPDEWRLFFRFLTDTGVRIGEAIELRWKDVACGPEAILQRRQAVRVERKFYRGKIGRPKSRYGRRTLPAHAGARPRPLDAAEDDRRRGRRARLHRAARGTARPLEPDEPRPEARRRPRRRRRLDDARRPPRRGDVGRLPHVPAHLRDDALPRRLERRPGAALARPPQAELHDRHVRPPARRGRARARRDRRGRGQRAGNRSHRNQPKRGAGRARRDRRPVRENPAMPNLTEAARATS